MTKDGPSADRSKRFNPSQEMIPSAMTKTYQDDCYCRRSH